MNNACRLSLIAVLLVSLTVTSDADASREVRCSSPGLPCAGECGAIGATCSAWAPHPYHPEYNWGDLYWCKSGTPTWTCSYKFSNGKNCTVIHPLNAWLCSE